MFPTHLMTRAACLIFQSQKTSFGGHFLFPPSFNKLLCSAATCLIYMAFKFSSCAKRASLEAQIVKNSLVMRETWVRSLGWEDTLEMWNCTTLILWPGEFYGQRSLAGSSPRGHEELDMTEELKKKTRERVLNIRSTLLNFYM